MTQIFHYTSIKSLALILNSGKIRFTRLDLVDDMKEVEGIPEKIQRCFFISCWTEEKTENISLWQSYTDMKGVRIEFPQKFFFEYSHCGDYGNWGFSEPTICPLSISEIRTDNYFILNPFWLEDGFYVKVEYIDDYDIRKNERIKIDGKGGVIIDQIKNLVCYKSPIWEAQKESRFYLMAVPLLPLANFRGDRMTQMKNIPGLGHLQNEVKYIDVTISKDVLDNIIIRLHPQCDHADQLIIQSLLAKFTNNGKVERSDLDSTLRPKRHIY